MKHAVKHTHFVANFEMPTKNFTAAQEAGA